ncbi:MAG TPA: RidA family protein, partial [Fimbriimonadaceae bacterium]|nr:RidA family protein [Fimbriimonadaceae bacterium]
GEDPATRRCDTDDVAEQTRFALENVKTVLAAAGATLADVVRVAIYMKDLNDRAEFNRVYREYFPSETAPARFAVGVTEVGGNDKSKFTLDVVATVPR